MAIAPGLFLLGVLSHGFTSNVVTAGIEERIWSFAVVLWRFWREMVSK